MVTKLDRRAGDDGLRAERDREMRLAHAGRPEQQHALLAFVDIPHFPLCGTPPSTPANLDSSDLCERLS